MSLTLPKKCFISHAYSDKVILNELLELLPNHVTPVIFNRIDPNPNEPVSDGIIPTILDCDGLIYIKGSDSINSFWVYFERDYALRSNLLVISFDPKTKTFAKDNSKPIKLNTNVIYHRSAEEELDTIFSWMEEERNFKLYKSATRTRGGGISGDVALVMEEIIMAGGVILWVITNRNTIPVTNFHSEGFIEYLEEGSFIDDFIEFNLPPDAFDHCSLSSTFTAHVPVLKQAQDFLSTLDTYFFTSEIGIRLDPSIPSSWSRVNLNFLDLLVADATDATLDWSKVDNLIIQIFSAQLSMLNKYKICPPQTIPVLAADILHVLLEGFINPKRDNHFIVGSQQTENTWMLEPSEAQQLFVSVKKKITTLAGAKPQATNVQAYFDYENNFHLQPKTSFSWSIRLDQVHHDVSSVYAKVVSKTYAREYSIHLLLIESTESYVYLIMDS